jgi:hypothetical protein
MTTITSCRKQVAEQASHHFMASMTAEITGIRMTLETDYNHGNGDIVIGGDSIFVKRAGLYHLYGKLDLRCLVINPDVPGQFKIYIALVPGGLGYTLCNVLTTITGSTNATGEGNFSIDLYLEANTKIIVGKRLTNINTSAVHTIDGYFGGYRKSN